MSELNDSFRRWLKRLERDIAHEQGWSIAQAQEWTADRLSADTAFEVDRFVRNFKWHKQ